MGVTYYCSYCNYETDHKAKHNRHMSTLKHQISENGIVCCGLVYYEKHKWVNHKKSVKHHQMTKENGEVDPLTQLNVSKTPKEKITLSLTRVKPSEEEETSTKEENEVKDEPEE